MVNPLELRLGNYVLYNGQTAIVSGINSPAPRKDKNFDGKYIIELVLGGLINCIPEELEPVILTEEILLKFGATKIPHKIFTSNYELPLKRNISLYVTDIQTPNFMLGIIERDFETNQIEDLVYIHNWDYEKELHAHQLQNLIFTLTGKELKHG